MDSKMLEAFIALYEKRSLRQAASALYISPQGLSRLLQNLEGELNVILFKRTARGIIPTAAGDYFYSQAVDMLASYRQLASNLQSISGMEKDLSFVCGYGAVNALPYQVLLDFQEAYPQYKISWREFPDLQAEQLLIKGDYHLGLLVMGNSRLQEQFVCQPLFERDILLLVYEGHPLYHASSVDYKDLEGEPVIMEGRDFWIYENFRQKCIAEGFCPNILVDTGDISFSHKLCSMKQGLTITVDFIADFIPAPHVRKIPFRKGDLKWQVALVYPKAQVLSPADEKFCQYLLKHFRVH